MGIIEQSLTIAFIILIGYVGIIVQTIGISRLLPRSGWGLLASVFIAAGLLQLYRFVRFPAVLLEAQSRGYQLPESLTLEQKLVTVGVFIILIGYNLAFYRIRKGLREQGLGY